MKEKLKIQQKNLKRTWPRKKPFVSLRYKDQKIIKNI